jgi:putative redox protein
MAEELEVRARFRGGFRADVTVRGHELVIDEPTADGGGDEGMMPTEALWASLASCFCLALAWAARKRDIELPGLEVTVRAERAGRELRYGRVEIEASADVEDDVLEALMPKARRVCWVSNTLEGETEYVYRSITRGAQR